MEKAPLLRRHRQVDHNASHGVSILVSEYKTPQVELLDLEQTSRRTWCTRLSSCTA